MSGALRARRRRRTPAGAVAAVVLAVSAAVGLLVQGLQARRGARAAFPVAEGAIEVAGLAAAVEIFRDASGVPHIEADAESDAFFGLGFVHAQDRLAQMLWLREAAAGRAAQRAGPDFVPADRLARLLDITGLAQREYEELDGATRQLLDAYARGVTARIERIRDGAAAAPLALRGGGVPLDPWRATDSLALLKLYAWGLSGTLDVSLVLSDLVERLGPYGASPFFPPAPGDAELAPPGARAVTAAASPLRAVGDPLRRAAGLEGRAVGSSAWVVAGRHTQSGRPLLAADAHLAPTAPPYLHVAHLRAGSLDVAGAMIPGLPLAWTGMNRRTTWASTHARAVTSDLYEETLHETDPLLYHDGRGWRRMRERVETIRVRGGEDVTLRVRTTRHGPLLDGLLGAERRPLALAWVGAAIGPGSSVRALLDVARAGDAASLRAALAGHREPPLAVVYADADGAAGMQVAGWIPYREFTTPLVPLPGRARVYEWSGGVPFEELPHVPLDERRGWVIAADNGLAASGEGAQIGWLWRTGERARRIDRLLAEATGEGPLSLRRLAALQTDVASTRSRGLVERVGELVAADGELGDEAREVLDLLAEWDGEARADSVGSAVYHVFRRRLTAALFARHLGDELAQRYVSLPQADPEQLVYDIVAAAAAGSTSGRWTDHDVVLEEVRSALRDTWFQLSYRMGPNRSKWSWGRLHQLSFRAVPSLVPGGRADLGPFGYGGNGSTIRTAEYEGDGSFDVRVASTFRFAIDAGALEEALFALAPGQSEHPRHPHHTGGLERWLAGHPMLLATSRLLVEELSPSRLVLNPAPRDG